MRDSTLSLLRTTLTLLVLIAATVGCSETDFSSQRQIEAPRVLGAQLTPPEVAPEESTLFRLFIAQPFDVQTAVHVHWTICLFTEGPTTFYRCTDELPNIPVSNILAQGEGKDFVLTQDVLSNTILHAACDALRDNAEQMEIPANIAASLPKCQTGLPVKLRTKVCFGDANCSDVDGVVGIQTLTFLFAEHAQDADRNQNPTIQGVALDDTDLQEDGSTIIALNATEQRFALTLTTDAATAAQTFHMPDDTTKSRREDLQSDWYVTTGKLGWGRRYFWENATDDDEFRTNTLTLDPADLEDGERVGIWVTLRDSRNGQGVIHRSFTVSK